MKILQSQIEQYLESKRLAWSPSTQRSEAARLNAWATHLDGNPSTLWAEMERREMGRYSRVTTWTRIVQLVDWLRAPSRPLSACTVNPYKAWRAENARLFKNAYVRRKPEVTFEEAERLLKTLPADVQRRGLEILGSGMRYTEAASHEDGHVVGKGGLVREVFVPRVDGPEYRRAYTTFVRHLRSVGLKPHDLRKLALTRLVELGANEFELCEIAGWTSLAPARSYIKVKRQRVEGLMKGLRKAG
jgi:hypothetical protein